MLHARLKQLSPADLTALSTPGPTLSPANWRWLSQYSVGDDGAQAVAAVQCLERLDRAGHPREAMRDEVVEHDLALRDS